jgi:hypothetical protein
MIRGAGTGFAAVPCLSQAYKDGLDRILILCSSDHLANREVVIISQRGSGPVTYGRRRDT